jgi:hypothetical protein
MRPNTHVLAAAAVALGLLVVRPAAADFVAADLAADSELVLRERVDWGTYHDYTVRIRIQGRRATLFAEKDGVRTTAVLPLRAVLSLWSQVQAQGIDRLASATPDRMFPDQSSFRVEYRVRGRRGGFSAYAVDSLSDARYRSIVRNVLRLADAHARPHADAR